MGEVFPLTSAGVGLAFVFAFLGSVVSFRNTYDHVRHWADPTLQRSTVRIVLIVPVYAMCSWLSLVFPESSLYVASIRDVYEAYVIYLFLVLIVDYAGGSSMCATALAERGHMPHPWPLCWLPHAKLGGRFLRRAKQWTLQFVIVKPIFAVSNIVMLALGKFETESYQWTLAVVYNISYTVALMALMYMYLAIRTMIGKFHPVRKFVAVKGVVFMTYYQALAVVSLPGVKREDGEAWNDLILCVEMLGFAILHFRGFPSTDFTDAHKVGTKRQAVMQVISIRDVIEDTVVNFHPRNTGQEIEGLHGVNLLRMDFSRDHGHNLEDEKAEMAKLTARFIAENM